MNIKAAAVFRSIELPTQETVVLMVLNDQSHCAVDSCITAAASGSNSLGTFLQLSLVKSHEIHALSCEHTHTDIFLAS